MEYDRAMSYGQYVSISIEEYQDIQHTDWPAPVYQPLVEGLKSAAVRDASWAMRDVYRKHQNWLNWNASQPVGAAVEHKQHVGFDDDGMGGELVAYAETVKPFVPHWSICPAWMCMASSYERTDQYDYTFNMPLYHFLMGRYGTIRRDESYYGIVEIAFEADANS